MAHRVSPARTRKESGAVTYSWGRAISNRTSSTGPPIQGLPPAARTPTTYRMAANSHTSTFDLCFICLKGEGGGEPRPMLPTDVTNRCYPLLRVAFALELVQQAIDLFLLLHRRELRVDIVADQFRVCLCGGFAMTHLALHAVEGRRICIVTDGATCVRGLVGGGGAPVLGDQHVALRFRLRHFLLQAEERRLQVVHLRLLILHLLPETGGGGSVAHAALHGGARQSLIFLVDGESRAVHPLPLVLLRFLQFLLQDMLVGDR